MAENDSASRKIRVPLMPLRDCFDISTETTPTVGKLTVELVREKPGVLSFGNPVDIRTTAAVDAAVMGALDKIAGSRAAAVGLKVTVDEDAIKRANGHYVSLIDGSEFAETRNLDLELLEVPILVGALGLLGVGCAAPDGALCWGKVTDSWSTSNHTRSIDSGDSATANYLAKVNGYDAFAPRSLGELVAEGEDTKNKDLDRVLNSGSSLDFIREMCSTGYMLAGVPVPQRARVLAKARKVFDDDVALWDQNISPLFEEAGWGFLTIVAGDFYGNPRMAELERDARGARPRALPNVGDEDGARN